MPTTFTTSFIDNNNEFVHADHVKQFASPINNLENGAAHYSPDTGSENIYRLNFAGGNAIEGSAPTIGRRINFKAKTPNSGASVVVITGVSGELSPIPLTKRGGEPLESGDIAQHQAVSAIYVEDQGVGRFEVLGARPDTNSPAGSLLYTYDPAPSGYLEANGQVVDQAAYPELFSQIGLLANALSSASSWTKLSPGTGINNDFQAVIHPLDSFVAVGWYATGWSSEDGLAWSSVGLPNGNGYGLTYGQGLFVAVGDAGEFWTSSDGWSWQVHTGPNTTDHLWAVTYGGVAPAGKFVAVGRYGTVWTSPNGLFWTKQTGPNAVDYLKAAAYGNGVFVAAGDSLAIWTSSDAVTWSKWVPPGGASGNFKEVLFANGLFVAVGEAGNVWTSPDGYNWTKRTGPNTSDNLKSVTFGNSLFVIVGWDGVVWTSPDAITWTKQTGPNASDDLDGIAYSDGMFVAVGRNGVIWVSAPGYGYDPQTQFALPSIPPLAAGLKAWLKD